MNVALIAVVGFLVATTGREVETAGDLLVKENVFHGLENVRIKTNGELAHIARALVGVEDAFKQRLVARGAVGLYDLAFGKFKADAFETISVVQGGRVVLQNAFNAVAHGRGEDLAVWNIAVAATGDNANVLDTEAQIGGAGALDVHLVGALHALHQRRGGAVHCGVVQRAHAEIKVLKVLRVALRKLRHACSGPAQNAPTRVVDSLLKVHGLGIQASK